MAFSTQKDFFYVPFMNEDVEFDCKKACVQLKSYDSTIDDRSWAMDETKQSNFLSDLVSCRTPIGVGLELGGRGGGRGAGSDGFNIGDSFLAKHGITGGDSVLECANITLGKLECLLMEKQHLQNQLDISNERLQTANEENQKIKSILQQKFDSSQSKDFYNKIQKLSNAGKISKSEENELLSIQHKVEDMHKAYEILQAENCYLKRLLDKISRRTAFEAIKLDPETSTDIPYLQNTINCLRKEVTMLRTMEDENLRQKYDPNKSRLSDRDADNLKAIIKERNALREKCKTFKDLEKKVQVLQKKTKEADQLSGSLSNNLDNQSKYIGDMEHEMKRMQNYYEEQMQKTKFNEEVLKCQLEDMKEELMRAKCEAQRAEVLQMEVACLRNEITKRDVALSDYDCQYKQLMSVIGELKGNFAQSLQDTETQTCADYIEDLAFFASATLSEIMKELEKRCSDTGDTYREMHAMEEAPRVISGDKSKEECCLEIERLQKMVNDLKGKADNKALNCEEMCADALKRLKELEAENSKLKAAAADLKSENDRLNQSLKGKVDKLDNMAVKLDKLDQDVTNSAKETAGLSKDLDQSLQLVKDISDIQLKNQQLASAVNAINSRDDQKLIDDLQAQLDALRKQLAAEQEKNKKCQEENEKLQADLKKRGIAADAKKEPEKKAEEKKAEEKKAEEKKHEEKKPEEKKTDVNKIEDKKVEETKKEEKKVEEKKPEEKIVEEKKTADKNVEEKKDDKKPEEETKVDIKKVEDKRENYTVDSKVQDKGPNETGDTGPTVPTKTTAETELPGYGKAAKGSGKVAGGDKSGGGGKFAGGGKVGGVKTAEAKSSKQGVPDPYKDFVNKNAVNMTVNLKAGNCLEKELRAILDAFIQECGFCFCQCKVPKSKFYAICHKILHNGLQAVSFRELVYMHKKLFMAAERMHPGCLLSMILSEQTCGTSDRLKCCTCKNTLCCNNSEEMLREKVFKLERDIEMAKEYLDNFKCPPQSESPGKTYRQSDPFDFHRDSGFTYRRQDPCKQCPKSSSNRKQLKQLKVLLNSDFCN